VNLRADAGDNKNNGDKIAFKFSVTISVKPY